LVFFVFSSRRRHTRFSRDWSSDVCSSDLDAGVFTTASQLVVVSLDGTDVQLPVPRGCKLLRKGMAVSVRVTQYRSGSSDHELVRSEERRVGKACRSRGTA